MSCFFLVENMWTIHVVCTHLEVPNLNEAYLRRTYVFVKKNVENMHYWFSLPIKFFNVPTSSLS